MTRPQLALSKGEELQQRRLYISCHGRVAVREGAQQPKAAGQHHIAMRGGLVWFEGGAAQQLAPGACHGQEGERRAVGVAIAENQGSMPAGIEDFCIGESAVSQLYQHLLQPGAVNLAGVVLEDAHDLSLYKVECQGVEVANVA